MLIVMIAIGTTDLMFALDSIPAIFGLTKEPYLVFTANVFALMGLRQLYFLLGGLLRAAGLPQHGLAVVLGFIGVKLVLEALHDQQRAVHQRRRAASHWAPEIPIWLSLLVILGTLGVATVASLFKSSRDRRGNCGRRAAQARAGASVRGALTLVRGYWCLRRAAGPAAGLLVEDDLADAARRPG